MLKMERSGRLFLELEYRGKMQRVLRRGRHSSDERDVDQN